MITKAQYDFLWQKILALEKRLGPGIIAASGGGGSGITALTGDVTATGPGSAAATIANDAVSNAKLANMAQATIKGRAAAAGTGDPTDLTADQVSTILDGASDPFSRTSVTAPNSAQYVVMALSGSLSAERRLIAGPNITIDDGGANGDVTISGVVSPGSPGSLAAGFWYPDFVVPVNGDFAWVNQGTGTVTVNDNGSIFLFAAAQSGVNLRIRKHAIGATNHWRVRMAFLPFLNGVDFLNAGIVLRESGSGKLATWNVTTSSTAAAPAIVLQKWNSATSFNAQTFGRNFDNYGMLWFEIEEDGTTRHYRFSFDGFNYIELTSEGRTVFITADEVGFFADTESNLSSTGLTVYSWEVLVGSPLV